MIKRIIRRLLGTKTYQAPKTGRMAVRSRFDDIRQIISDVRIVVDAGAAHGDMSQKFLEMYPNAIIHAIEPNPSSIAVLQKRFQNNPRVIIHPVALGSYDGIVEFNVLERHTSSSILLPTSANKSYHAAEMDIVQKVNINLRRLDDLIKTPIDILKLDLQGYELEALKGMINSLKSIKCITTEVEFVALYENQALFGDVDSFLRGYGFSLYNLYELWTQEDGQLTAGDAVYIKAD